MRSLHVTILGLFLVLLIGCKKQTAMEELQDKIKSRLSETPGSFAVAYLDLDTGDTLLINERMSFHAASTMKTPVMIEVYKQAASGKFNLTDSLKITNEFTSIADGSKFTLPSSSDSEKELYNHIGENRTIAALTYDMIIMSSNLATNMIIELVGARNVTESMRQLGAKDIKVLRGVEDLKAFEQGMSNTTTAYDLMIIFEKLANGEVASRGACTEMIDILMDQKFNHVIPRDLPSDVRVAHKTGSITGVQHDSGIVFLPDGRSYIVILLSADLESGEEGADALADVSRMIYDYKLNQ